ncbi:MAG: hypothetical protein ACYDEP_12635 [Acidimicrobiales bacterium]
MNGYHVGDITPEVTAATILGSKTKVRELEATGLAGSAVSDFTLHNNMKSPSSAHQGRFGMTVMEFRNASGAVAFSKPLIKNASATLPGIASSSFEMTVQHGVCPSSLCATGGFIFQIRNYVVEGGADCSNANICRPLLQNLGVSTYDSISRPA